MSKTANNRAASHEPDALISLTNQRDATDFDKRLGVGAVTTSSNDASIISDQPWKKLSRRSWVTAWTQRWHKLKHPAMTRPYDRNDPDML